MPRIPIIRGGDFYWHEFSDYPGAERVHPVIFARLVASLQEIRNLLNSQLGADIMIMVSGFTRTEDKTQELISRGIKASKDSYHHVERACAVDFVVFDKETNQPISPEIVTKIISPERQLYDFMLPHFNKADRYFTPYGSADFHIHIDFRTLAKSLGIV